MVLNSCSKKLIFLMILTSEYFAASMLHLCLVCTLCSVIGGRSKTVSIYTHCTKEISKTLTKDVSLSPISSNAMCKF